MKKFGFLFALVALWGLSLSVIPAQAEDSGRPVQIALTLPGGGSGTNVATATFASAVARDVSTSLKLQSVEWAITGGHTADGTLSVKRAAAGPTYLSVSVPSNTASGVSFESNNWYWLRTDTVVVSGTLTNAGTVTLTCTER